MPESKKKSSNKTLCQLLGKETLQQDLIIRAFTHRSANFMHNERLEFLGDAVLGLLISEILYIRFKQYNEGELTRLRAYLVCSETLFEIAQKIRVQDLIIMGQGEERSGGRHKKSLLENTLEAVIGALYLLQGKRNTRKFINEIYTEHFKHLPPVEELKDAKSKLQEILQQKGYDVPVYTFEQKGLGQLFEVFCKIKVFDIESFGKASSKKAAEQIAAMKAIEQLSEKL